MTDKTCETCLHSSMGFAARDIDTWTRMCQVKRDRVEDEDTCEEWAEVVQDPEGER